MLETSEEAEQAAQEMADRAWLAREQGRAEDAAAYEAEALRCWRVAARLTLAST